MERTGYLKISLLSISTIAKQSFEAVKIVTRKSVKGRLVQMRCRVFCIHLLFEELPIILETPVQNESEYQEEIRYLRKLKEGSHS